MNRSAPPSPGAPCSADRIEEFEAAATALLTTHAATAALVEDAYFRVILARRPAQGQAPGTAAGQFLPRF